ncbi:hypothetical protein AMECASPLE_013355 [Ameca splendens]|uniref:Uncharacterized protein n=1 Tax=Ameca splendens TaxID=208324 RepID=A0ABV0YZA1_9TELE
MGAVWVLGIYTVTLWLKGSCLPVFQIVEQYEEQQKMQNGITGGVVRVMGSGSPVGGPKQGGNFHSSRPGAKAVKMFEKHYHETLTRPLT